MAARRPVVRLNGSFQQLPTGDSLPVSAGGTGATNASDARTALGLGNVDNTSDASKPISTATQTALDGKMSHGAYGLGGVAIQVLEANINDSDRPTQFCNFTAGGLGILPLNINGYGYHFDNASAGFAFQEYVPVTANRKFLRRQASSTWGGWSEYAFLGSAQTWTGKQTFNGFIQVGDVGPAIKMKKLTGTTAATEGGSASANHGVTSSKVIGVQVLVFHSSTNAILPGWVASAGYQYDVQLTSTGVQVVLHATNSENILSKAFTVLITYEE